MKSNPKEIEELFGENLSKIRRVVEQSSQDQADSIRELMNACQKADSYLDRETKK
jgi:hypothetical protein